MVCLKPYVKRVTVRFPFNNGNDSNVVDEFIPGPATSLGGALTNTSTGVWTLPDPLFTSSFDVISQRFPVASPELLTAISIAPDSPIHSADIGLSGRDYDNDGRTRISPGNPLFRDFSDVSFLQISVPVCLPVIDSRVTADRFAWDASPFSSGNVGASLWQWPLRLELWYGLSPVRAAQRSSYHASARVTLGAGSSRSMYVLLDGRRRVAADISATTATATLAAFGVVGIHSTDRVDSSTPEIQLFSTALAAGGNRIPLTPKIAGAVTDEMTPWTLVRFQLSDTTGTGGSPHELDIHAWD